MTISDRNNPTSVRDPEMKLGRESLKRTISSVSDPTYSWRGE